MEQINISAVPETPVGAGASRYSYFGVSITHKGQLAMRGTTPDKYDARMRVFARDGDTKVVMVNLERAMHKSDAARILANSTVFADMCVAKGHDWATVQAFLQRQAGAAAVVPVLRTLAEVPTLTQDTVQDTAPEELAEVAAQDTAQADTAAEPDTAQLLEQQEAADAGEELQEESVEASRKARKRR